MKLEILKPQMRSQLYQQVDSILSTFTMEPKGMSYQAQSAAVAHCLQKMFQVKGHFSVCIVEACANMCQVMISKDRKDLYNSIHCLHWHEMTEDFRNLVTAMVLDDFREVLNVQS